MNLKNQLLFLYKNKVNYKNISPHSRIIKQLDQNV